MTAAGIAGTGAYAPARVVTNHDLAKLVDTSDEWIVQRTGIRERRFAAPDEATSDMCLHAARQALAAAHVDARDLDLILVGTVTPDQPFPSVACRLQRELGAVNAAAMDVAAACTGFLAALHTAEAFVASGRARRVLICGAETLSRFIDMADRTSCILFGDGAGAAVIVPHAECGQGEILASRLGADGTGYEFIQLKAGGSRLPASAETVARGDHYLRMRGREVFRFAVTKMSDLIAELMEGRDLDQLALVVPHQVNARIIEAAIERLGYPPEKFFLNIDRYGNTSAASVPTAFQEALQRGRVAKGKLVVFVAFGAGLTWGGTLLRW